MHVSSACNAAFLMRFGSPFPGPISVTPLTSSGYHGIAFLAQILLVYWRRFDKFSCEILLGIICEF
jgi:hypothetical protein